MMADNREYADRAVSEAWSDLKDKMAEWEATLDGKTEDLDALEEVTEAMKRFGGSVKLWLTIV